MGRNERERVKKKKELYKIEASECDLSGEVIR